MESVILVVIIGFQVLICLRAAGYIRAIGGFFPPDRHHYHLEKYNLPVTTTVDGNRSLPVIGANYHKIAFKQFLASANDFLTSHYRASKAPPLSQVEQIAINLSKKYDSMAGLFASFPILIGLGGTIGGLIYAFSNMEGNDNFLGAVSSSAKIVFVGSLTGIFASIVLNACTGYARVKRNVRLNEFVHFVNVELAPLTPSLTEETIKVVSSQLDTFSQEFFVRFQEYAREFKQMTGAIGQMYDAGIKGIIERNSEIMAKLTDNIDKLESLNDTTSSITFDAQVFKKFMDNSSSLTATNQQLLERMNEYGRHFSEVNESFKYLYEKVEYGVVSLGQDRDIITNLHNAMSDFATTTVERTKEMNDFTKTFKTDLTNVYKDYQHALHEIRDTILTSMKENLDPEAYQSLFKGLMRLSDNFEKESTHIGQLGSSLTSLTEKLDQVVIPGLTTMGDKIKDLAGAMETKIPAACEAALETNKQMTLDIVKNTYKRPRSWGEWSYQGISRFFRRSFNKRN